MIVKRLDDITEDDLRALISNGVAEGRTIEYKRELPGNSDGEKKEFLADASSFANTGGGDLVFGMEEAQGLPTQIIGFQSADIDLEIRRLESILASGIDPRIQYGVKVVTCRDGQKTLIIRLERSWSGPHRVVFKGHDKFYGRNTAGKYPLDVNDLRAAFALSGTVTERIRAFRTDRIIALSNNQTPIPFTQDSKVVMHCIPVESFSGQPQYDVLPVYDNPTRLRPMGSSSWARRLNLEGVLAFTADQPSHSYTQLYRNGVLEAVRGNLLAGEYKGKPTIPSVAYEKQVFDYLPSCFRVLQEIGASVPVVVALTLTNTRGLNMGVDRSGFGIETGYPIQADTLVLPETVVDEFSMPVGKMLKPLFDLVWNACGYASSQNFDPEGNWVVRR
jgi:hypothetical protein